ncbi:MAG: hypothetical protein FWC20_01890 [Oscillospiraceae bacterium]|nr:hypothetical protein [Oscillospiraceae bacterium]MCL2278144.1 hypothetical protein [Oscillospiraceae bacterium]
MSLNEWGLIPGSQDNLLPEDAPMLSELECSLVNIFRGLPEDVGKKYLQAMFSEAMSLLESDNPQ